MSDGAGFPQEPMAPEEAMPPLDLWHSFDATPWAHPWLTYANLSAMRDYSRLLLGIARDGAWDYKGAGRFAFVGNIANNMYIRAAAVARDEFTPHVFGVHGDNFAFSDPRWEHFSGELPGGPADAAQLLEGVPLSLPFEQFAASGEWANLTPAQMPPFVRPRDFRRWPNYFAHLPALQRLQDFDSVLAAQSPYLAYLSGRPYLAATMGGDIWFEAARADALGQLQRLAFRKARALLVSNPWTYAHARRYGFTNAIYLPYCIDDAHYSPGEPVHRADWIERTGGDFFVLSTARMDSREKGSEIGIEGFAEFARSHPGARLVMMNWGEQVDAMRAMLDRFGVLDRVLLLPVAGKQRLIEYLRSADCLLEQFKIGYFGSSALEAAGCGLPVIMRLERRQYDAVCATGAPPFLNAISPAEVKDALVRLSADGAYRARQGAGHRSWLIDNHSGSRWWPDYLALLRFVAAGHRFDFSESPLSRPLTRAERAYHEDQVQHAPPFPQYYDMKTESAPAEPPANPLADPELWGVRQRHYDWLADFRRRNGRAPRVLSLGNIGNNAYRDGLVLRRYGVEVDVLSNDYYHVMGCPEWEEVAFEGASVDEFKPQWSQVDMGDFERPRWFASGRLDTCLDYLIDRNEGGPNGDALWAKLRADCDAAGENQASNVYACPTTATERRRAANLLEAALKAHYPDRLNYFGDNEAERELAYFINDLGRFRRLFSHYDLVIGYATYGFIPLVAGKRPFLAYEHGTIRSIPFEDNLWGRVCAVSYACADGQLVTNADNVVGAERLRLKDYRFVPHTTNDGVADEARVADIRARLEREHQADFVIFHPARHHWEERRHPSWEKGNDIFIRGFARFVREVRPKALAVFVDWGQKVAESRALLQELGIADRVVWIGPQPAPVMRCYTLASDALADQFHIGTWGNIIPQAMHYARPAFIHVDPAVHAWALPEMPPVIESRTPDDVFEGLKRITDRAVASEIAVAGRRWYDRYHSASVVAGRFIDAMMSSLAPTPEQLARRTLTETLITRQLQMMQDPDSNDERLQAIEARQVVFETRYMKFRRAARFAIDPGIRMWRALRRMRAGGG